MTFSNDSEIYIHMHTYTYIENKKICTIDKVNEKKC